MSIARMSALVRAPDTLNTLNEISAALGADVNFATTITTALGEKQTKFIQGALPATNSIRLFDSGTTRFRSIHCAAPMSVATTLGGDASLTLTSDTYSNRNR